jgi:two-component system sensor histidine kinase KdpD
MVFEFIPVFIAAILSAATWDYFFIPPHFTLTVGSTEDSILLLMYFIIALVNASLTYKIRVAQRLDRDRLEKAKTIYFYNALLNSLSHELRTPIATIIGASDSLLLNPSLISEQNRNQLLQEISTASVRLNEQVENLLNISRLESGIIKPKTDWCDINELVFSALKPFHSARHKIHVHIPENFPLFKLDFVLMENVLHNLISNAITYTPENSVITIEVNSTREIKRSNSILETLVDKLIITLTDNGPGFPKDEIQKVFEKFYRLKNAKSGGTGLGLSIVKGFIEAHGGTITLENITSGGSRFRIEIPTQSSEISLIENERSRNTDH